MLVSRSGLAELIGPQPIKNCVCFLFASEKSIPSWHHLPLKQNSTSEV